MANQPHPGQPQTLSWTTYIQQLQSAQALAVDVAHQQIIAGPQDTPGPYIAPYAPVQNAGNIVQNPILPPTSNLLGFKYQQIIAGPQETPGPYIAPYAPEQNVEYIVQPPILPPNYSMPHSNNPANS